MKRRVSALREVRTLTRRTRRTFIGMKAPVESKVPISPSSSSVHHSGRPSLSSSSPSLPARRRPPLPPWPSESRKSKSNFLRRLSPGPAWSRQPAERGPSSEKRVRHYCAFLPEFSQVFGSPLKKIAIETGPPALAIPWTLCFLFACDFPSCARWIVRETYRTQDGRS